VKSPPICARVPAFPSLSILGLSQIFPGLELSDAGLTQKITASGVQIVRFDDDASQTDFGVPDSNHPLSVIVFSDEEDILQRDAEPRDPFKNLFTAPD
jgi:hypothetical protein